MIELEDCGRELHLGFPVLSKPDRALDVTVIMVIKAPRGVMALFEPGKYSWSIQSKQCKAIKAFMEEHRND